MGEEGEVGEKEEEEGEERKMGKKREEGNGNCFNVGVKFLGIGGERVLGL